MKILLVLSLVAAAVSQPVDQYVASTYNYHGHTGVHKLARIKAIEEAIDFDGSRIVGGSPANLGQFPYMGGMIITLTDGRISLCGSSLLSNTLLVSAAHCWDDGENQATEFTLILGSERLYNGDDGGHIATVTEVRLHPDYNPINAINDVMTFNIPPVEFTGNIGSITLARGTNLFDGATARAAGFGLQSDGGSISRDQILHQVDLVVISNDECRDTFGSAVLDSTLCTSGFGGRGTCRGDSGGPLVIGTGAASLLIGVASFGSLRGCEIGEPSAFSRVTSFADWIESE